MWNHDGKEIAFEQIELGTPQLQENGKGSAQIKEKGEFDLIKGEDFCYRFNLHYGWLETMGDYLKAPLQLTIWKAPTDNEMELKKKWYEEKYDKVRQKVYDYSVSGNQIRVKASLAPVSRSPLFRYEAAYTIFADGTVHVELDGDFVQEKTFLPRLGFECKVEEKDFAYFGYGHYESYIDMHHGSWMGRFESNAQKEYVPYVKPQEHGSHYNTKYLKIGKYAFVSRQGFSCNVSEYTSQELTEKAHGFELSKDEYTNVRIDYKVSGIGSASCGPELMDKYRMNDGHVHFAFSIIRE